MTDNVEGVVCQHQPIFGGGGKEVFEFLFILFYFIISVWVFFESLAGGSGWLADGSGWRSPPGGTDNG